MKCVEFFNLATVQLKEKLRWKRHWSLSYSKLARCCRRAAWVVSMVRGLLDKIDFSFVQIKTKSVINYLFSFVAESISHLLHVKWLTLVYKSFLVRAGLTKKTFRNYKSSCFFFVSFKYCQSIWGSCVRILFFSSEQRVQIVDIINRLSCIIWGCIFGTKKNNWREFSLVVFILSQQL